MSGQKLLGWGVLLAVLCIPQATHAQRVRHYQQRQQYEARAMQGLMQGKSLEQTRTEAWRDHYRAVGAARAHRRIVSKHLNPRWGTTSSKSLKSRASSKKSPKADTVDKRDKAEKVDK
jgi:hypothetical protein